MAKVIDKYGYRAAFEANKVGVISFIESLLKTFDVADVNLQYSNTPNPVYTCQNNTIHLNVPFIDGRFYYMKATFQIAHEIVHHITYQLAEVSEYRGYVLESNEILCSAFALYVVHMYGWEDYFNDAINNDNTIYKRWKKKINAMAYELIDDITKFNDYLEAAKADLINLHKSIEE